LNQSKGKMTEFVLICCYIDDLLKSSCARSLVIRRVSGFNPRVTFVNRPSSGKEKSHRLYSNFQLYFLLMLQRQSNHKLTKITIYQPQQANFIQRHWLLFSPTCPPFHNGVLIHSSIKFKKKVGVRRVLCSPLSGCSVCLRHRWKHFDEVFVLCFIRQVIGFGPLQQLHYTVLNTVQSRFFEAQVFEYSSVPMP